MVEKTETKHHEAKAHEAKPVVAEHKVENIHETKTELKKEEPKAEEPKKAKTSPITKKEEAVARGVSLPISKKHSMYICTFIKNKTIDGAIADLQDVIKFKRAVPFKGEIPHRKGNMMSGRYPIKASKYFINLLKALRGNIITNGMDLDKSRIVLCSANWAPRPQMRGGARFKRAHVTLTAKEKVKEEKKENKK